MPQAVLRTRPLRFGAEETYSLEDGALVRRSGARTARWPLSGLRRLTLGVRRSPYAGPIRFVKLRFERQSHTLVCAAGTAGYGAFVAQLARTAVEQAPGARFEREGGRTRGLLLMTAILLGAGATALALSATMAGLAPLGLALGARLTFLLILIFALTPWIGRAGPRALDPMALPSGLL